MTDRYGDAALEVSARRLFQRSAVIGGVISIVTGLVLLIWPKSTLLVIAAIVGIWLIFIGAMRIMESLVSRGMPGGARLLTGLVGLAFAVVGILALQNLFDSLRVLAVAIGLIWVIGGIAEVVLSLARRSGGWAKAGGALLGALSIVAGVVVMVWPGLSLVTLVWLTGLWLIALGAVQLVLAYLVRGRGAATPTGPVDGFPA